MPDSHSYPDFYVVGGTLRPGAPSYVNRRADEELFNRALAGDFCYVLTSRQMGKSSLMAHTARRLIKSGVGVVIIDLTRIGAENEVDSADRWYYGIARCILRELKLHADLGAWWLEHSNLPALQRLMEFLSDMALAQTTGRIVIFVDEIDTTISLPFTDDFFAAIRACYNARATEPDYHRLSFILLGVASPADLIKDNKRTPFNIGHRVELTDFTAAEAMPLALGLGVDPKYCEQILKRILHWTSGHPYLTQKLCQVITQEKTGSCDEQQIDSLVEKIFLSATAKIEDSNLEFVRNWLTYSSENSWNILKLYRRICRGHLISDSPLSPIHTTLKLSGVVKQDAERLLRVRNQIYQQVFTDEWAKEAMRRIRYGRTARSSSERIGPYRVLQLLGRGGFGTVYLAERGDISVSPKVAIKISSANRDEPLTLMRFRREAQVMSRLAHPNIAQMLDVGTMEDGTIYLVTEYVPGLPIDRYCKENDLSIDERLKLFLSVCSAIHYAHELGIIHRDLKPSNILVSKEGVVKLLDFGLAKFTDSEEAVNVSSPVFTPTYASPDQLKQDELTPASDVYSLGVILHELLTGQLPYNLSQPTILSTVVAIIQHIPSPPSETNRDLSIELDLIMLKALQKNPQHRYPTVEGLASDIQRYLGHPVQAARSESIVQAKPIPPRRVNFAAKLWNAIRGKNG